MNVVELRTLFNKDPGRPLIGTIVKPAGGTSSMGVIVIGMGIADMQAVKRFAKLGFVAMQIRLISDNALHQDMRRRHETYDLTGVARCRQAMDLLAATHGVERFVLMGNCALANISFNTARADARVAGMILTNPHIPEQLARSLLFKLRRHLLRWRSWTRLLNGDMKLRPGGAVADEPAFTKDLVLPPDFDRKLEALLTERAIPTLLVFSSAEPSLHYFRRVYRQTLKRLIASGKLQFDVVPTEHHDFSAHDESALRLNEIVNEWAARMWPPRPPTLTQVSAAERVTA